MLTNPEKISILFTDSGLGGLVLMANFQEELAGKFKERAVPDFELIFFNAQYRNDLGYNKMTNTAQRVQIFNRALSAMQKMYRPDLLGIACNTLSSIYELTDFSKRHKQVRNIIQAGENELDDFLAKNPTIPVIVLATPATIHSNAYRRDTNQVMRIAAQDLANLIESETDNNLIEGQLNGIFNEIKKSSLKGTKSKDIALLLGCTHYPIIEGQIIQAAQRNQLQVRTIINPEKAFNETLLAEIETKFLPKDRLVSSASQLNCAVQVVSQVRFPRITLDKFCHLIKPRSEKTALALQDYQYQSNLF